MHPRNILYTLISAAILFLALTGCNQAPKQTSTHKPAKIAPVKPVGKSPIVKIDSPLICVDYSDAEVGKYSEDNEAFEDFVNGNKNYFKGKKSLSDEYVKKHLLHNPDSVEIEYMPKVAVDDYLAGRSYYLISKIAKKPQYDAIIYEELADQEAHGGYGSKKYLATIDKKGKLISDLAIAGFHHQGTYVKDDGTKGGYYTGEGACISKDLVIDVSDRDIKYKVHANGQIIKFFYVKAHYDSLLAANPNDAETHFKYASYLTHRAYNYAIDSDDMAAKKQYELALKLKPDYANACEQYAVLLWDKFRDTVSAQRYLKKAIDLVPNSAEYKAEYKAFLNRHSTDKEIIKGYEKSFKGRDSIDFVKQMDYAHFLYGINRKSEGRKHYLKAIQFNSYYKNKTDDELFGVE